jgi:hypothetical protein
MVRAVVAVVWGLVLALVGLALAANFRGVTEWHIRAAAAISSGRWLGRIPPWRWLRLDLETRVRRRVRMERLFGVLIAVAGAVTLMVGVVWLGRLLL